MLQQRQQLQYTINVGYYAQMDLGGLWEYKMEPRFTVYLGETVHSVSKPRVKKVNQVKQNSGIAEASH